ncbi:PREDICTED: oxidoreductase NAD-binding domain-containing protein 1-like [Merops nubicus]|uniref:oxidoreductase NAD-binding domain-containing protein 1-like n=1 Tax=Merops nubicus TaxID=57421 RepID=UPI0004F0953E|nr:PREDICTED: oxidoreductase NAD-binding domain-containing protein 1-like [Merops nubicus]
MREHPTRQELERLKHCAYWGQGTAKKLSDSRTLQSWQMREKLFTSGAGDSKDSPVIMAHAAVCGGFTVPQVLRGASRIFATHSALGVSRHSAFCSCTVNSTIKSKRKMDHLERTANNFRQEVISQAKVCGITSESETVKRLRLAVANKDFTFKAGQW